MRFRDAALQDLVKRILGRGLTRQKFGSLSSSGFKDPLPRTPSLSTLGFVEFDIRNKLKGIEFNVGTPSLGFMQLDLIFEAKIMGIRLRDPPL